MSSMVGRWRGIAKLLDGKEHPILGHARNTIYSAIKPWPRVQFHNLRVWGKGKASKKALGGGRIQYSSAKISKIPSEKILRGVLNLRILRGRLYSHCSMQVSCLSVIVLKSMWRGKCLCTERFRWPEVTATVALLFTSIY
jgi:hypothetical protein